MAVINTTEDFIRAMDENPSWLEAVRSRVLTRDLIELPARFAEHVEKSEREFRANREQFATLNANLADLKETVERESRANREQFAIVNGHLDALDRRMGRFEQDMARFRARHVSQTVRGDSEFVAEKLGCEKVKTLSRDDLTAIVRAADTDGIPVNDLRSFRRADLVMEAVRIDTGATCYIAVEISYTVNGRDTRRAIRNAGFLRRFTGKDALAVVAGVRKDNRVDEDIAANGVAWYELDEEELGTE